MASNLIFYNYKPGIQRDGTNFQGDIGTDGLWVRFQRGKVKKIGGMKAIDVNTNLSASAIAFLPFGNQIYYFICDSTGVEGGTVDNFFNSSGNVGHIVNVNNPNALWQFETVIKDNKLTFVFLSTANMASITDNSTSTLFYGTFGSPITQYSPNILSNGGMCYSNPYLFLYGSNGFVQYSRSNDPFNFTIDDTAASGGTLTISNDKVIWGRAIRGGPNAPAILFWTLSSVVRISNVGTETTDFQIDVISKSSSILSSRCVIEYDGLFFWPGTDRFFVYNGLVQEIVNNTNLNYFFDNIDMNYRQKVFGVKMPRYGELWWFYPEKIDAPNRINLPEGSNTRALIYNKRENTWYDTAISRDCGVFSQDFGFLATYGMSFTNPQPGTTYLWRHEYGVNEAIPNIPDAPITSSFTGPKFGWSSFNPIYNAPNAPKGQPIDRWIEIRRIEPNFILLDNDSIGVEVNTQVYAQSPVVTSDPFVFFGDTEKIDMRIQGRQMSLTFFSEDNFEMGNVMLLVGIGDGQ